MGFGSLFEKSWKEYSSNFKGIFNFVTFYIGIPFFILTLIGTFLVVSNEAIFSIIKNPSLLSNGVTLPFSYMIYTVIVALVMFFLGIFEYAGVIGVSVSNESISLKNLVRWAKSTYFRCLGFLIVVGFFLFILFLPWWIVLAMMFAGYSNFFLFICFFILPFLGIVFMVYWVFAIYIFYIEKKGIIESLRRSIGLVKRKWWRVFGNLILVCFIYFLVTTLFSIPTTILRYFLNQGIVLTEFLYVLDSFFVFLSSYLGSLAFPFLILFFKNFYFELKTGSRTTSKDIKKSKKKARKKK